jgi:Tfp pilus assembly protein PilF
MVWAMSFPPRKLDRLSINTTSNVFSTLETVANSVECSYQMESSMKNTKNYSRAVRLQPPPLYGLLAFRHILYGISHIFYAKPLAIRTRGEDCRTI